jgi:metal-sulfur cluster biosynthetic enzyme
MHDDRLVPLESEDPSAARQVQGSGTAVDEPTSRTPTAVEQATPSTAGTAAAADGAPSADSAELEERIRNALKEVIDPEIGLDIMSLGLIYEVKVTGSQAYVLMTLTSPGCPVAGAFMHAVYEAASAVRGISEVNVDLTFSPPWDPRTMASDEAKMMMGFYY